MIYNVNLKQKSLQFWDWLSLSHYRQASTWGITTVTWLTAKKASFYHVHVDFHMCITWGCWWVLSRPTSRCRRTESIVSLEKRVCSCAELQVFSCYRGWKEACQATRARDFNNIETRAVIKFFFPARQGAEENSRHSDRNIRGTCAIACHHQKLGGPV